ncbi:MAG: histidine--tRNA ligase [Patescibacteria group bacterium]
MKTIQPRTLKGFRDFLPDDMVIRQHVIAVIRSTFERYGYAPLETPTLEYADILLGKYGEEAESLMYRFTDRGDRDVAMKYDLTVPTCRVLAQYQNEITLPFKRYQIQPVWRAENTQKGRFREFYQCDADAFGSTSQIIEAEFIQMGIEALTELGFDQLKVRINNRKIIDGIIQYAEARELFADICTAIDKLDKIGLQGVQDELEKKGVNKESIGRLTEVITLPPDRALATLRQILVNVEIAQDGIAEIERLFRYLEVNLNEISQNNHNLFSVCQFDPTIIRGLSYYTGPVWEFTIEGGGVGSVGGGGRYDNLVNLYSGKDMPAAGGSLGIERIIEVYKERRMLSLSANSDILITVPSEDDITSALQIAKRLRDKHRTTQKDGEHVNESASLRVEVYAQPGVKLEKQLRYANKKKIPYVVIMPKQDQHTDRSSTSSESTKAGTQYIVKNMKTGEQEVHDLI